ncbi:MAG: c-type cytochrome [Candidatus Promineofilum sp.]|nr:c-type cytochrome [Promineifilum sp.]
MVPRKIVIGAAVVAAGIFWLLFTTVIQAQIERGGPAATRTPIPPTLVPGTMPTPDRLAPPPTVLAPTQADEGAQLYWLHCQPCHGDRGQGLTDEWREQYPPEEEYCWESGCHGNQPYNEAFALPTQVPAVIEAGAPPGEGLRVLQKFETMDAVYRYVSVAMPYFFPGDLTQEEYLAITAFLVRENGLWDGETLTTANLGRYRLRPPAAAADPADARGHLTPTDVAPPTVAASSSVSRPTSFAAEVIGLLAVVTILTIGGVVLWRKHAR